MDARKHRDGESFHAYEPISAHADDERYGRPARPSHFWRNVSALLTLIAAAIYLLSSSGVLLQSAVSQVTSAQHPQGLKPAISNPVPPIYTSDALIAPKPLADCIKPDNIIDEAVATCRYGQFPRANNDPVAQGMVTASYMAKYKADQQPARTKRVIAFNIERATVWQWDGKRTYAAEWAITDNHIDDSSVCANYRRGSIEYRECRKGAKVYFREKCREWGKRWSTDHRDSSKALEQRFCSAGEGFNPLG
jgi:hypothetical protein